MKVLITGGTGFIGSRLAMRSLARGDDVRVYGQTNTHAETENAREIESKGAEVILGSMIDDDLASQIVEDIEVVYHLAAAQHEANVPDQIFWDVNVRGTQTILEASQQSRVRRFVHGSTIGVYGSALGGMIDEQSDLRPDNIYGVTKRAGEEVVLSFRDNLPVVIIRISETYGPGDRRLLKLFKGIDKGRFFMIGKGDNIHHLIYVQDLIDGFFLAGESSEAVGEIFTLAGKEPLTTTEMVRTIADVLDKHIPGLRLPLFPFLLAASVMEAVLRPIGIQPPLHRRRMDFFRKSFLFSQKKTFDLLGFAPKVSFYEGVKATAEWYRQKDLL